MSVLGHRESTSIGREFIMKTKLRSGRQITQFPTRQKHWDISILQRRRLQDAVTYVCLILNNNNKSTIALTVVERVVRTAAIVLYSRRVGGHGRALSRAAAFYSRN